MGMGIEENEIVVAKIIANDSKEIRPLAIRVKDFEVHSVTKNEAEVALERLKKRGIIKEYKHCWGFFAKEKGKKYIGFEKTGTEPQFDDDGGQSGEEAEVYLIDFSPTELKKYLEQKRIAPLVPKLIERRGEDFVLNNEPLHFTDKDSIHYKLFSILYGDNGESKTLRYSVIDKELLGLGERREDNEEKQKQRVRNAVNNGLHYIVDKRLKKYVKVKPRYGVAFLNPTR